MDNVYEKLFDETIEVGDIISQNAINNKVYKSCNYKKIELLGFVQMSIIMKLLYLIVDVLMQIS